MANLNLSSKKLQIDKANATIMIAVSVAAVLIAFSLVFAKALLGQRSYQSRVITEQKKALKVAKDNVKAADELVKSYRVFNTAETNLISGSATGTGDRDGDNAKLVLDALPNKYDFPGLISSLEKSLKDRNFKTGAGALSGTDVPDETVAGSNPAVVEIPFQVSVSGSYSSVQGLIEAFDRTIRPISLKTIDLSGDENNIKVSLGATTYYQPSKTLTVTTKVVK